MSKSLNKVMLILGALGVAALLATSACETQTTTTTPNPTNIPTITPTPTVQPGEDEDRPPVIISGGSVHLRAVAKNKGKGTNNDEGEWKYDRVKKQWSHEHGSIMPAKHLLVHVLYGKDSCTDYKTEFDVLALTLKYGSGKSFKVFIDDSSGNGTGSLTTDADGKVDSRIPFWLDVGTAGERPTGIVFYKDLNSAGKDVTCGLDSSKAEVHIYQRIK